MSAVRKHSIEIINPAVKREGRPPRDLTMQDVIIVPVDYNRGSWRIIDILDNNSALALLKVYNQKHAV